MKYNENVIEVLKNRSFIEQYTHENEINKILKNEKVTFYIGFDPTADSLHVGHFLTIMATIHMQNFGHTPIILIGGGTGMVGDPTDRTDMRKMMTKEEISTNVNKFKNQLSKFISFDNNNAIIIDNSEWLCDLNYIDFLREYGIYFSVNRMITADAYKTRLERGLSFLEFNYMIMQAYDFLELNKRFNCRLQIGGKDQWSNIISGIDLIRRVRNKDSYGLTLSLLTTSNNKKMGKTQNGTIWLDINKTSSYEFFQYWRNIDDNIVIKCLKLLTFLPISEIEELAKLEGSNINKAKNILAYEITKIVHGESEAIKSLETSKNLFQKGSFEVSMPSTFLKKNDLNLNTIDILLLIKLASSKSDARRLIEQGGIKINNIKIDNINHIISIEDFKNNNYIIIQKGKKVFHKIILK